MIEKRIKDLGLDLPLSSPPGAMYVPVKRLGHTLYVSGQIPSRNGVPCFTGKVGKERSLEYAQDAARLCVVNMLAAVKAYTGDLDKVKNVVKLLAFVNSETGFGQQHLVVNAASELLEKVFGENGRHARSAVGTNQLPLDVTVEIEGIFEVEEDVSRDGDDGLARMSVDACGGPSSSGYDFETMVNRDGIGSMKLFCTPKVVKDAGVVSYFAAEMDYKTAPVIIEAMIERAKNGLMGFTLCDEGYKSAIKWWMRTQRDWHVEDSWIVPTYGTIHSVATAIRAFTQPGEGVIIQPPVYFRYEQAMKRTGRSAIHNSLVYADGRYEMDFGDLERCMANPRAKLMVLCNPHNPLGRVWGRDDLARVAELAEKYNVIVFSDEIFAEIVFGGHVTVPYSEVEGAAQHSIVSTSLGKTFNYTGVNNANMIIPNEEIRERFRIQRDSDHYGSIDPMAHASVCAAYTPEGADWVRETLKHLEGNLDVIRGFFEKHLPKVRLCDVQGAYVLWIDWRGLGLDDQALEDFLVNECFFDLEPGSHYGTGGSGFTRMSIATTRSALEKSLAFLLEGATKRGFAG